MKWPFFLLLAWMPLVSFPLSAQEAAAPESKAATDSLSIDFRGGSLADLLLLMQQVSPQPLNIIDRAESVQIPMPALKVEAVSPADLMEIIDSIFRKDSTTSTPFTLSQVTRNTWLIGRPDHSTDPFSVRPAAPPHPPTPPQPPQPPKGEAAFFPVGRLLEAHSVEDLLTTVSTAWEMLELSGEPSDHLRFHEDTKLLIVTGDQSTLILVKSALGALESESRSERENALMKELEEAKRMAQHLEESKQVTEKMIDQSKAMAAQEAKIVQRSMEADLKRLEEENAKLRAQIRELESKR